MMALFSRLLIAYDVSNELEWVYSVLRNAMQIHFNSSSTFVVHVWIDHLGLLEIKKLITLLVLFEPFLYNIVAPQRRNRGDCLPVATASVAACCTHDAYLPHAYMTGSEPRPDLYHGVVTGRNDHNLLLNHWLPPHVEPWMTRETKTLLRRVWNSTTRQHLKTELLSYPSPRPGLHMDVPGRSCIQISVDDVLRVEDFNGDLTDLADCLMFCHREATCDSFVDGQWINVCVALVRCAELPLDEFRVLVATVLSSHALDFAAHLGALGLDASVEFWQTVHRGYTNTAA